MSNANSRKNPSAHDLDQAPNGRLLSLDLGAKRVGVAISDESLIAVRPLPLLPRTSWKELLRAVRELVLSFDAKGLVIGLPLNLDGTEGSAAGESRRRAHNFHQSLNLPVYLQDERLTTREAEESMRAAGATALEVHRRADSEAAVIILRDFIVQQGWRQPPVPN